MRTLCLLSVLVLGISAHAKSDGPIQCTAALVASTISQAGSFAIGAFVLDNDGGYRLLSGSYLTGAHEKLLLEANRRKLIQKVLWMGEMRFELSVGKPLIHVVNHTSKTFLSWQAKGWNLYDHVVPVTGDGNAIPVNLRASDFTSIPFNVNDQHLAPEFEHKSTNIRHDIINSFSVLNSALRLMHTFWSRDLSCTRIEPYLATLPDHISNVTLALTYLLTKKTIDESQVPRLLLMIEALKQMPIARETITQLDLASLKQEIEMFLELHYNEYEVEVLNESSAKVSSSGAAARSAPARVP